MIISEKNKKILLMKSDHPFDDIFEELEARKLRKQISSGLPIYFYRILGLDDSQEYTKKLQRLCERLKSIRSSYLMFTHGIDKHFMPSDLEQATKTWDILRSWYEKGNGTEHELYELKLPFTARFSLWEYKSNLVKLLKLFDSTEKIVNTTIRKNFAVMMIAWSFRYLDKLMESDERKIPKLVYYGPIKRNEAYFLMFCSFFGCDVLYINPEEDYEYERIDPMNRFTAQMQLAKRMSTSIFENLLDYKDMNTEKVIATTQVPTNHPMVSQVTSVTEIRAEAEKEKSYEELAALSASVVLINIYKHDFFPSGNGSGVVIDDNGLILTNYHVVRDGGIFGVVFENDEREYTTHKLVDYNEESDLALIRIILKTKSIPIHREGKLRRGQQIVAIGSPLGLMNTISDGIIAGFRKYKNLEYIQITAPMSPGSSGGALLDRYGRLVGITTAGFADGQNLNLAVPIEEFFKLNAAGNR